MPDGLPPVERPNGKLYRPRGIVAESVRDDDGSLTGVIVFGTHDPGRALPLARDLVRSELGRGYEPVNPGTAWWRDTFSSGRRCFECDEVRGRAGVWFAGIVEVST